MLSQIPEHPRLDAVVKNTHMLRDICSWLRDAQDALCLQAAYCGLSCHELVRRNILLYKGAQYGLFIRGQIAESLLHLPASKNFLLPGIRPEEGQRYKRDARESEGYPDPRQMFVSERLEMDSFQPAVRQKKRQASDDENSKHRVRGCLLEPPEKPVEEVAAAVGHGRRL